MTEKKIGRPRKSAGVVLSHTVGVRITQRQHEFLVREASRQRISISEVVQRGIDSLSVVQDVRAAIREEFALERRLHSPCEVVDIPIGRSFNEQDWLDA